MKILKLALALSFALAPFGAYAQQGVNLGNIDNFGPNSSGKPAFANENAGSLCDTFTGQENCMQGPTTGDPMSGVVGVMDSKMSSDSGTVGFSDAVPDTKIQDTFGSQ